MVIHEFGPPSVLVAEEVSDPAPGPHQVVVDVEAANITFVETQVRAGRPPNPSMLPALPAILGNGVGGAVARVGEQVDPGLIGRRVVTSLGGTGGYAQSAVAEAAALIDVPDASRLEGFQPTSLHRHSPAASPASQPCRLWIMGRAASVPKPECPLESVINASVSKKAAAASTSSTPCAARKASMTWPDPQGPTHPPLSRHHRRAIRHHRHPDRPADHPPSTHSDCRISRNLCRPT